MRKQKIYEAIDLTGGSFGSDRRMTIEGWREQAIEWSMQDDDEETADYLELLRKDKVLPFIAYVWSLKFNEVTEDDI